ncbi:class I SAM-dependent methyltransferase [Candidatus Latescibacterota bacterium]
MKLRLFEKALIRNPVRMFLQSTYEAPRLFRDIRMVRGGRCLELGCGYGSTLIRAHTGARQVIATDIDLAMVRHAARLDGINAVAGDAVWLPFGDGAFDGVFHFFVFDHVPAWERAVREVFRVLKPGGVYGCEEALIPEVPWFLNRYFGHVAITAGALRESFARAGFILRRFDRGAFQFQRFIVAEKP